MRAIRDKKRRVSLIIHSASEHRVVGSKLTSANIFLFVYIVSLYTNFFTSISEINYRIGHFKEERLI